MRINFSLSLKLTLIVISLSAIVIFSLTYINIQAQSNFLETTYSETATGIAKTLDASIQSSSGLTDKQQLQNLISNITDRNPEILKLSINVPDENRTLMIVASSTIDAIGGIATSYNNFSYTNDALVFLTNHSEQTHIFTAFAPINISGHVVGTYEMDLSMIATYTVFDAQVRNLVLISAVSLFILIFWFLFLLRQAVVKPINAFRDATKQVGEGNLEAKIHITSRDELGDLSTAFNRMTIDLKTSRDEIERYNKMLEKLLKQKDAFIGQLGHDLKHPLTPLVGLLPMIIEKEKDPEIKNHLHFMYRNVTYMKDLIFKTLELARLRSSDIFFTLEKVNLRKEVSRIVETHQLVIKDKNITVVNAISDTIDVMADKLRLEEVFNNLLTNALKFTLEGGNITINAIISQKEKGFVTISVQDTGIGMTNEELSNIFNEFYRPDVPRHELESSGLGLAISKRIVEKFDGHIWAESPGKGKGSTLYFTLKLASNNN